MAAHWFPGVVVDSSSVPQPHPLPKFKKPLDIVTGFSIAPLL